MNKEEIEKLDLSKGDILIVTLPDRHTPIKQIEIIQNQFATLLENTGVRSAIVPQGMKVELLRKSPIVEIKLVDD